MHNIKICLVTSSGGHLYKTHLLNKWWKKYPHFWVTNNDTFSKSILNKEKVYFAHFPENRNLINALKNLILAFRIYRLEKPTLVFSMGAGIAPPFFLAAKVQNIKTVFIETFILTPKPTLSGKLAYPITNFFFVQSKKLLKKYPKAKYFGNILGI